VSVLKSVSTSDVGSSNGSGLSSGLSSGPSSESGSASGSGFGPTASNSKKYQLAIVVVSYGKPELVLSLLQSLKLVDRPDDIFTLIVDNATTANSQAVLSGCGSERVQVLFEQKNWGYFGGAQKGLEWLQAKNIKSNWIAISNSDIEIRQVDFVSALENTKDLDGVIVNSSASKVGVLAPSVRSSLSLGDQNPFFAEKPSRRRMHFYKWCYRWYISGAAYSYMGYLKDRFYRSSRAAKALPRLNADQMSVHFDAKTGTRLIYAPHGSFILFHERYFLKGGNFRHEAFLFNEEFTVAERCREFGFQVLYHPGLAVEHVEHATMGAWPNSKIIGYHGEASRVTADMYF
jgi:GT2 family glycosyltransferase